MKNKKLREEIEYRHTGLTNRLKPILDYLNDNDFNSVNHIIGFIRDDLDEFERLVKRLEKKSEKS